MDDLHILELALEGARERVHAAQREVDALQQNIRDLKTEAAPVKTARRRRRRTSSAPLTQNEVLNAAMLLGANGQAFSLVDLQTRLPGVRVENIAAHIDRLRKASLLENVKRGSYRLVRQAAAAVMVPHDVQVSGVQS